jgi:hypothetical protein
MCLEDWSGEMKEVRTGPPPSYEKIRGIIEKKVRRI